MTAFFFRNSMLFWIFFYQCCVGDFSDPVVALWNSHTFQLLSSVSISGPVHDASFSPSAASRLACVGSHGLHFCVVQACGSDVELRVGQLHVCLTRLFAIQHSAGFPLCRSRQWEHQQRWGMWRWRPCPTTRTLSSSLPQIEDMFASGMLLHSIVSWPGKLKREKLVTATLHDYLLCVKVVYSV